MNATATRPVTAADLERFCADRLAAWERYRTANGYTASVHDQDYRFTIGPRYARITVGKGDARSAFCFIDLATGNILKSASWKTPAKGIRGNIFADDGGASGVTVYGARYAR